MRLIKNGCPDCGGHLLLIRSERRIECEECKHSGRAYNKRDWDMVWQRSSEWGPKSQRYDLTLAGQQLVDAALANEAPATSECYDAALASKGLLRDSFRVERLMQGNFILPRKEEE